jgi:hypothetical protein
MLIPALPPLLVKRPNNPTSRPMRRLDELLRRRGVLVTCHEAVRDGDGFKAGQGGGEGGAEGAGGEGEGRGGVAAEVGAVSKGEGRRRKEAEDAETEKEVSWGKSGRRKESNEPGDNEVERVGSEKVVNTDIGASRCFFGRQKRVFAE